jgi:hypothetical protein
MNKKVIIFLAIICFPVAVVLIYSLVSFPDAAKGRGESQTDTVSNVALIKRGEYLVTTMGCNDCHSPKYMTPHGPMIDTLSMLSGFPSNRPIPEYPADLIKKGLVVFTGDATATMGPWGTSFAANLTPDDSGIGAWTEAQFKNAITHGKFKGLDGSRMIMPPMPWQNYVALKDEDIKAIFHYLKSLPPYKNLVPEFRPSVAVGK